MLEARIGELVLVYLQTGLHYVKGISNCRGNNLTTRSSDNSFNRILKSFIRKGTRSWGRVHYHLVVLMETAELLLHPFEYCPMKRSVASQRKSG